MILRDRIRTMATKVGLLLMRVFMILLPLQYEGAVVIDKATVILQPPSSPGGLHLPSPSTPRRHNGRSFEPQACPNSCESDLRFDDEADHKERKHRGYPSR